MFLFWFFASYIKYLLFLLKKGGAEAPPNSSSVVSRGLVNAFAVEMYIQALALLLFGDAKSHRHIEHF